MSGFEEPVSRRGLLAGSAVAASAVALAGCAKGEESGQSSAESADASQASQAGDAGSTGPERREETMGGDIVAFDGKHQAGIQTPVQAHVELVGFNLKKETTARGAAALMRLWTEDARRLCTGENPLGSLEPELSTTPANLTVTCGWGEGFFDTVGVAKPSWLRDIQDFEHDDLRPEWGQTDIVLQICSDDAFTAAYVLRHMTRAGKDYADVAWIQQGFSHAYGSAPKGTTARNLFGQKDGTVNPRSAEDFNEQVWIEDGPFAGGSAMVVRRIHMNLDTWEQLDRAARENATGRALDTGAPLGGKDEFDEVDLDARNEFGLKAIDENSHVARAHPPVDSPHQKLLRRPYNYNLPPSPETTKRGELSNAGLIFICYQKDPTAQFEPIQARLDKADRLNEWITHIGSAVYYMPAGTEGETFWGESLIRS